MRLKNIKTFLKMLGFMSNRELFLYTLFNPREQIYVSPDKYSSAWDKDKKEWKIYRPSITVEEALNLEEPPMMVGINPIEGLVRSDKNVTAYRTFFIEIDDLPLGEQKELIKTVNLPYSCAIYSGNRSIHYLVTLEKDLPNKEMYKYYAQWIIGTVPHADPHNYPPSKGTRFPGFLRPDTKKRQTLLEVKSRISYDTLMGYLSKHPQAKPEIKTKKERPEVKRHNYEKVPDWIKLGVKYGFTFKKGRNNGWFNAATGLAINGYNINEIEAILRPAFTPESDFSENEWLYAIHRGSILKIEE
jgi:hypothetical protein